MVAHQQQSTAMWYNPTARKTYVLNAWFLGMVGPANCSQMCTNVLFNIPSVGAFISKGKNKIVICEVETSSKSMVYAETAAPPPPRAPLTQPTGNDPSSKVDKMKVTCQFRNIGRSHLVQTRSRRPERCLKCRKMHQVFLG
jgi:hypothetical protein